MKDVKALMMPFICLSMFSSWLSLRAVPARRDTTMKRTLPSTVMTRIVKRVNDLEIGILPVPSVIA